MHLIRIKCPENHAQWVIGVPFEEPGATHAAGIMMSFKSLRSLKKSWACSAHHTKAMLCSDSPATLRLVEDGDTGVH